MKLETFLKRFDFDGYEDIALSWDFGMMRGRNGKMYTVSKNRKGEFVAKKIVFNGETSPQYIGMDKPVTAYTRKRVRKFIHTKL